MTAANNKVQSTAWDILTKLAVPLSIIAAGAMIRNEIVDARQEVQLERNTRYLESQPPEWLKLQIAELKKIVITNGASVDQRLSALAERMARLEGR